MRVCWGLNSRFLIKSVSFCVLCLSLRVNFEKICLVAGAK